jgi:mono/diheme cytochrome c family protein
MKKKNINLFVLSAAMVTLALFGCGSGNVENTSATGVAIDGAALYNSDCSSCHGAIAKSGKRGASVALIQDAIARNWGGMDAFANLTVDQLQAIATALSATVTATPDTTTATPPASTSLDGAALYTANCSSCHGPLATSSKKGATAAMIQTGISGNYGGMGQFSILTTAQIQALAAALGSTTAAPTPAGTEGATLYTTYCSSCHGALAASSKAGRTAAQIQTAIGSVSQMGSISLTTTQIQAIATALGTATPSSTPLVCGSCHAIPPATGHHSLHVGEVGLSCGTCHGTGYSSTTVNSATHDNGVVNISSTPGWNPTTRTCSNSCHGTHSW